jgi:ribosomal protein S18 acetylase RimI-like enzyme
MAASIRLALPADAEAVRALTNAAYAAYREILDRPPIPVTEDYAPRIEAGEVWMLEQAGRPAGLIVLETAPDHMMIFSIAVAPEFQGQGLGRLLLRFAEERARAAGLREMRLYTNAKMTRNIALYAHCGYAETGRAGNPARPGWVRVDMAKELPP